MQNALQNLQFQYRIYNSDIEPEHDSDYPCYCAIHNYKRMKWQRYGVQDMWSKAVMYPGKLEVAAIQLVVSAMLTVSFKVKRHIMMIHVSSAGVEVPTS